jgi:predicted TIM-barrel fold metal-dependent hydrolase
MDGSQGAPDGAKTLVGILAVSADSHITEPPNLYTDYIDPAFRERAPYVARDPEKGGEGFYIEGFARPVALGLLAAAGRDPQTIKLTDTRFEDLHRSGWDPSCRIADQDRDGVQAEFIYPTVGMLICNHPDGAYKDACGWAYNRWLQEYVAGAPGRLYGLGQIFMISPQQAIADLRRIKDMGFKGVMMPGEPETEEDYDQPLWDPFWAAAAEMAMPLSFHVLTSGMTKSFIEGRNTLAGAKLTAAEYRQTGRGPQITRSFGIVRNCQDILSMFIFGRVFERHPTLKVVCVEADAGWAPHFMYRMDHYYHRHRFWQGFPDMQRLPSDYFKEHIWLTFQDDWSAFQVTHLINDERLMWANDFPHSDSTWPWSQELLAKHTANVAPEVRARILRDNCAALYKIPVV